MRHKTVAVLLPAFLACSETDLPHTVTITDSAGVTVVTHSVEHMQALASWTLEEEPSLELGRGDESGTYLYRVTAVAPLAGQRIAVASSGTQEVLVFDPSGQVIYRIGRRGDGPGEFQSIRSIVPLHPDSLGVYDELHRRLSIFDAGGSLVREASFQEALPLPVMSQLLTLSRDEMVLFTTGAARTLGDEAHARPVSQSLLVSKSGETLGSIGAFPGLESNQAKGRMGTLLFSARTSAAVTDGVLVVGTAETTEIKYLNRNGSLLQVVRWPDRDRSVSEEDLSDFVEAVLASVPESRWDALRARLEDMPRADALPPYQDLLASPDGDIWVGDYPGAAVELTGGPSSARRWIVVGSGGVVSATIDTPYGFHPLALTGQRVLGVFKDELGVETLQGYRITVPTR